jgi:hypothetical protein
MPPFLSVRELRAVCCIKAGKPMQKFRNILDSEERKTEESW